MPYALFAVIKVNNLMKWKCIFFLFPFKIQIDDLYANTSFELKWAYTDMYTVLEEK